MKKEFKFTLFYDDGTEERVTTRLTENGWVTEPDTAPAAEEKNEEKPDSDA